MNLTFRELLWMMFEALVYSVTAMTVYTIFILLIILYEDGLRNLGSNLKGYLIPWRRK